MKTEPRPSLSFDGKGINGPDEYRERIATFTSDIAATIYGNLFSAAPDLMKACRALMETHGMHGPCRNHNCVECLQARKLGRDAIAKGTGST